MNNNDYPRDLIGYGPTPPNPQWPNNAKIAVQFVVNYEVGAENNILHGDSHSEAFLSEIIGSQPMEGKRNLGVESCFEYGSRVGIWRLFKLFKRKNIPLTLFSVAMALERNPAVAEAAVEAGYDFCCHGYKWINYQDAPIDLEREHMHKAVEIITRLTGKHPEGWFHGRIGMNTRKLVVEEGGFLYDSDDFSDDLPFWQKVDGKDLLIIPYTLDNNDLKFVVNQGFNSGEQFYNYLKDGFDALYEEGEHAPKMMSIGLHERLISRPGRIKSLERFIDYILNHDRVWVCRRADLAKHWYKTNPPCG